MIFLGLMWRGCAGCSEPGEELRGAQRSDRGAEEGSLSCFRWKDSLVVGLAALFRHGIMRLFSDRKCKEIASRVLVAKQVENMRRLMEKHTVLKRAPPVIPLYAENWHILSLLKPVITWMYAYISYYFPMHKQVQKWQRIIVCAFCCPSLRWKALWSA